MIKQQFLRILHEQKKLKFNLYMYKTKYNELYSKTPNFIQTIQ